MTTRHWLERSRLMGIAWVIGIAVAQASADYYVAVTGSDGSGDGSQGNPWASVTNAVARVAVGDVIRVGSGVYTQSLTVAKADLTIQGGYNPSDWSWDPATQSSVLFGNSNTPVTLSASVTNTLRFLTLCGGTKAGMGGVVLSNSSGAVLDSCVVTGNTYGVYLPYRVKGASIVARNTLIARNTSYGIYANTADQAAGKSWLYQCTLADNGGHGYYGYSSSAANPQAVAMTNTLVTGNNGFGVYLYCQGTANEWGAASLCYAANSLFHGNARGPWYSKVVDAGGNKLCQAPKYVDVAGGDYRLQSSSPAATAGLDLSGAGITTDLLGVARPGPNGWDMGAYQGSGTGAPPAVAVGYISTLGSDANDGSSGSPWASVAYGVGRLSPTGTLYVAGGVYTNNVWLGEGAMAIRGGYDPSDWSWNPATQRTVIHGNVTNPPVTVLSTLSTNTLSHLTLCGGTLATADYGAGLRLSVAKAGCQVVVEGCTITNNYYGIHNRSLGATLTLRNTLVARNTSHGLYDNLPRIGGGTCLLLNCTIADNGGSGCYSDAQPSGFDSGPMAVHATNTLFTGNAGYGVYRLYGFRLTIGNSLFHGNPSGPWYSGRATDSGNNQIGVSPAYVDAANGDYRLVAGSLAAAAGANLSGAGVTNDLLGVARPGANGWDMGAHQGSAAGAPPPVSLGYVSASGSDSTGEGSASNPWASITYGVSRLAPVGTLRVAGGNFAENVWLGCGMKSIQGGYNPSDWSWNPARQATVVSGNGRSPITLYSASGTGTVSSLTLTGGGTEGGIFVNAASPCTLIADGCTITGNVYGVQSGDYKIRVTLRNCLVANNSSNGIHEAANYYDAGTSPAFVRLLNCTVADNGGNGCYVTAHSQYRSAMPLAITNTLFTGNGQYGIFVQGGSASACSASYSLLYGNVVGAWLATNTYTKTTLVFGDAGGNTTDQAPQYSGTDPLRYGLTKASPAFDTGLNLAAAGVTQDILGVDRPKFGGFDRGAFELAPPKGSVFIIR